MKKLTLYFLSLLFFSLPVCLVAAGGNTSHIVEVRDNFFSPGDLTINQGDTVKWMNIEGVHNVNGSLNDYPDNPVGFFSGLAEGGSWEFEFVFDQTGTYDYQCDPHFSVGMTGTITVLETNPYQEVNIPEVRENDTDLFPVLLGEMVEVSGVVYGENLRPQGLQFTIIDENNVGVGVFSPSGNFGYTVDEGDLITIRGTVAQFNGLAQIEPDEIEFHSADNLLVDPEVVTEFNESTESSLIMLENVEITNPGDWPIPGNAADIFVENVHGEFHLRIQREVNLGNTPPSGTFDLIGIGGQFTTEVPANNGYQLVPRYAEDLGLEPGDSYTEVSISEIRENDNNGISVLLGEQVQVTAVVYGTNLRQQGLQFTVIDENNMGVGIYRATGNLDYTVNEGDLINLKGIVSEFRGLTQITAEEIELLDQGVDLVTPEVVTELNENTESSLIKLEGVEIVNPMDWPEAGEGADIELSANGQSFLMRIQRETPRANQAPSGTMNVTGIGGQFTNSVPADDGYQIIPRYEADIEMVSAIQNLEGNMEIDVFPNPTATSVRINTEEKMIDLTLYDIRGMVIEKVQPHSEVYDLKMDFLPAGNYLLMVTTNNGISSIQLVRQ